MEDVRKFDIYTENYCGIAASVELKDTTKELDGLGELKKHTSNKYTKNTYELTMTVKFEINQYKDKTYLELLTSDIKHRIAELDDPTKEELEDIIFQSIRIANLNLQDM